MRGKRVPMLTRIEMAAYIKDRMDKEYHNWYEDYGKYLCKHCEVKCEFWDEDKQECTDMDSCWMMTEEEIKVIKNNV